MIYSVSDINERFQLLHKCMMKAVQRRRHRKGANANRKAYRQRAKPEIPRDKNPNYWQSAWGQLVKRLASIEGGPCITSRIGKLFRRRFRVPYQVYCKLVHMCIAKKLFGDNSALEFDIANRLICPIEIKMLSVLRILGRNWNFDDIAEATLMGETTARRAFHLFCENFVTHYYDAYVYRPKDQKLKKVLEVFGKMGLPGCIGSTDCVHLKWDRCPVNLNQVCSGKEGYPSLAYSCTVDHHRRILGSTSSFYGGRNDKTILRHDAYITDVRNKKVHEEVEYKIFVKGVLTTVKGVYYICDGGYHRWSCMINPIKHTISRGDRLWSEWVESTRKDVECTFGILKSRWRFLRNGIVLQKQSSIDLAFFTCCILHNLILEFDGLDNRWEEDVDWDQMHPQPDNSDEGFDLDCEVPSVQQRRIIDRVNQWSSAVELTPAENEAIGNEVEVEIDYDFDTKRRSLIDHFTHAYDAGLVKWPRCFTEENKACYAKGRN